MLERRKYIKQGNVSSIGKKLFLSHTQGLFLYVYLLSSFHLVGVYLMCFQSELPVPVL